ncbi:MAG: hypothetical protein QM741_00295 [Rudaea sp.]|uniref:hypothetical protein n=1 Tax=Rudaea sp. TaxID=2136325 RepID=UPI0039E61DE5
MSETPRPADASRSVLAVLVSALLGGLAGGMSWCFLALWLPWPTQFWIVPIAIGLAAFACWQDYRGRVAVACTALAIGIAFIYAQYLFGAVRIADSMGLSLREALFKAGFNLTADIAWANLRTKDWVALAVALLVGMGAARVCARSHRTSGDGWKN